MKADKRLRKTLKKMGLDPDKVISGPRVIEAPEIGCPVELADFRVDGRAVPWKAPIVARGRGGVKPKVVTGWQDHVFTVASANRKLNGVWGGHVEIWFKYYIHHMPSNPDVTNLQKAAEDALEGAIFTNDTNVVSVSSERIFITDREDEYMEVVAYGLPTPRSYG